MFVNCFEKQFSVPKQLQRVASAKIVTKSCQCQNSHKELPIPIKITNIMYEIRIAIGRVSQNFIVPFFKLYPNIRTEI